MINSFSLKGQGHNFPPKITFQFLKCSMLVKEFGVFFILKRDTEPLFHSNVNKAHAMFMFT